MPSKIDYDDIGDKAVARVLRAHGEQQEELLEAMEDMSTRIERLVAAFPEGDIEGHRRYHQTMIELLQERRRLRIAIQEKTISAIIWAVLVYLALAAFHELQDVILKK